MNGLALDWAGVLSGEPARWIASGLVVCALSTLVASLAATAIAFALLALRISPLRPARAVASAVIDVLCNTPLLVQLFFWYFAAYSALPEALRSAIIADHGWISGNENIRLLTPEFVCATWAMAWFGGAFLAEELRTGLLAVPRAQYAAALSLGFRHNEAFRYVLFPQALRNAWPPMVGQYLNLMKLSSLASAIGLAELTYRVREIEAYNAHALEAYAVGTTLYLFLGLAMSQLLMFRASRFRVARR
ncbi:amino acid ABC transporter permease [Niveibacterium terrae]|uniref:amino acid ABC transporter permease n=1 Tax=Niveibacterium terrae TaxID=3373598 RepID=UPI003A8DE0BA